MARTQITKNDIKDFTLEANDLASGSITRPKLFELRPHEQTVPNDTVFVESGNILKSDGTGTIEFAGGSSSTFSSVSANSRIDLLCLKDDGTLFIQQGTEAVSPVAPAYPTDKRVLAEVTVDETVTVVINDADIKDVRSFGGGGSGSGGITARRYKQTGTGTETVISLPFSYTTGDNSLMVFRGDGLLQEVGVDYTETNSATITLTSALVSGEVLQAVIVPGGGTTRATISFTSSTSVIFNHNLGTYPSITVLGISVLDGSLVEIIPNTITHTSTDSVTVTFASAQTGQIIAISGSAGRNDVVNKYKAAVALNIGDVVYKTSIADEVSKADATSTSTVPAIGISLDQVNIGDRVNILEWGLVSNSSWSFTIGGLVYLDVVTGGLTQTAPSTAGNVVQIVGIAKDANTVSFRFNLNYSVIA